MLLFMFTTIVYRSNINMAFMHCRSGGELVNIHEPAEACKFVLMF